MTILSIKRDGWELAYDSLAFTLETLRVYADDQALAPLATRIDTSLREWHAIESQWRALHFEALTSEARAQALDGVLDTALGAFAESVLKLSNQQRDHELYKKFFPAYHEEIIDLGLDAEIPAVTLVVQTLEQDETLDVSLRAHKDPLRQAMQRGTAALAARPVALANLGRYVARIESWLANAGHTQRATFRTLVEIAMTRGLPQRWAHQFFQNGTPLIQAK